MTAADAPLPGTTGPSPAPRRGTGGGAEAGDAGAAAFAELADRAIALRALGAAPGTAPLDAEPGPAALLRYVAGTIEPAARAEVESWVARSSWAYERVLALVRHGRKPRRADENIPPPLEHALARRLLDAARTKKKTLELRDALSHAFLESGAALAAGMGAPSGAARGAFELQRTIAAALDRGDEAAALAAVLDAIAGTP